MSKEMFSSTSDIVNSANSWNMAKDVGLLNYLKKISDDVIKNANETDYKLNNLLTDLNKMHINLDVVQNRFQSLHNTQFIESRVYEYDETNHLQENNDDNKKKENDNFSEDEKLKTMKNIILKGIEVIDKYYEKVEASESESDDGYGEDSNNYQRYTLRPKDPYNERPLPYVIGTDEWHRKWHVGLLESSSDSEQENVSENNDDSSSDVISNNDLFNKAQNVTYSETSSELEFFKKDSSENKDESETNSLPSQKPLPYSGFFAEELSAKLGDVLSKDLPVNTRPIQKIQSNTYSNFPESEPPPLDDDGDDDDLFKVYDDAKNKNDIFVDFQNDDLPSETTKKSEQKKSYDLFNDDDDLDEENDIFTTQPILKKPIKKSILIDNKSTLPFFDDEPPEIKKPFGGIAVVINDNKNTEITNNVNKQQNINEKKTETKDFFDDANCSNLLNDDLFSESKKLSSKLFDDVIDHSSGTNSNNVLSNDDTLPTDIFEEFKNSVITEKKDNDQEKTKKITSSSSVLNKPTTKLSLFDELNDDFDDLFSSKDLITKPDDNLNKKATKNDLSLFSNENNVVIDKDNISSAKEKTKDGDLFWKMPKADLFSSTPPELNEDWDSAKDNDHYNDNPYDDVFEKLAEIKPPSRGGGLFDSEPPSLEPQTNQNILHFENETKPNDSLFDNEPTVIKTKTNDEVLKPIDETCEKNQSKNPEKPPGKLVHSLNINVKALLPGIHKPKSENLLAPPLTVETETFTPPKSFSFDESSSVKTLESVTKNRVRAPLKRRPSTRKARQEFLRNTDTDFVVTLQENYNQTSDLVEKEKESITIIRKDEEREDFFDMSQSDGNFLMNDDELFSSTAHYVEEDKTSKNANDKISNNFFDDEDDDLFKVPSIKQMKNVSKSHLFSDEDSDIDDDLFSHSSKPKKNGKTESNSKKTIKKQKNLVKNDNSVSVINDPLNLLGEK